MVIISKIEYLTQVTFLTEKECNNIITEFRRTFKHKLSLPKSVPNTLMDDRNLYDFRNLYDIKIQAKITNFLVQINANDLLGTVTNIRLKQLQRDGAEVKNILIDWTEPLSKKHYRTHIKYMIALCKQYNLTFNMIPKQYNQIQQGDIPIKNILKQSTFQKN